ncbi:MAG: EcoRV family type II restriction endonuclease [Holophagales bacterium]|jgi:hypothetical protein|nr:EcoRV family type II restriction endonuclease [Holophagales bacterium]
MTEKQKFKNNLKIFAATLDKYVADVDDQWTVKGFIDVFHNVYTISADTKVISKILEIHLFPKIFEFARRNGYGILLADHQNYYPDITFISETDETIKFAVDLKTTYRLPEFPAFCNGFTLGSHGSYFKERSKRKNIQFPYNEYMGHFCLGAIYTRAELHKENEVEVHGIEKLKSIASVIKNIQFFACEKWEIASDLQGSGNTANIGSIVSIQDLLNGNGVFKNLGEKWFDEYWMNYGMILISEGNKQHKIKKLKEFLEFKSCDPNLALAINKPKKSRKLHG